MELLEDQIRPGDLITADFMNRLIDTVNALEQRISLLEQNSTDSNTGILEILDLQPTGSFRVGEAITVVGRNFVVPTSLNVVTISGVRIENVQFLSTSNENQLVFVIPPIAGLPADGVEVTLQVSNTNGSDSESFTLLPELIFPVGRIETSYTVAPVVPLDTNTGLPENIRGGQDYIFTFDMTAFADRQGAYQLSAGIDSAWTVEILEADSDTVRSNTIIVLPGNPISGVTQAIRVRVTTPNQVTGSASLQFSAVEISQGTQVTPGSTTVPITIGEPVPTPENRVRVSIRDAALGASIVDGVVQFERDQQGGISYNVLFTEEGQYNVEGSFRNPNGWEGPIVDPILMNVSIPAGSGSTNQDLNVLTSGGIAANATDMQIRITRGGTSEENSIDITYVQPISVV